MHVMWKRLTEEDKTDLRWLIGIIVLAIVVILIVGGRFWQ